MSESTNLEYLRGLLKSRLASSGIEKKLDENNNTIYIDVDIYSDSLLNDFLHLSLSEFNSTPHFTNFTFDHDEFCKIFSSILVEGATLVALASRALLEKGREFTIQDNGIYMQPPSLSELMTTHYLGSIMHHHDRLKFMKANLDSFKDL